MDEAADGEPEAEAAALDTGPLGFEEIDVGSFVDSEWIKLNYDTGAAVTAFPKGLVQSSPAYGNGRSYRTATGELIQDEGKVRATGLDENGNISRVTGRVAGVHKVLVSASRSASFGRNGWITRGGGYLIPDDSKCSRLIKKIVERESQKDPTFVKLYEENGVYNFYLKVGHGNGKLEHISETNADLKSLSKDELIVQIEKLEKEVVISKQSGLTRPPRV